MLGPQGHADGQGRPHQDVLATGVGPLVEPHDRGAVLVGEPHVDGRGDGPENGGGQQGPQATGRAQAASEPEHDQGHRRPHDVELLLDGQRPHVGQGRGLGGEVEVVPPAGDEVPVGHVEQGRQRVEAEVGELAGGGEDLGVDGHPDEHDQEGRQQPAGPAGPELAEPDAHPLGPLAQEERGDEESRQYEEDVDAEETPAGQRRPPVVQHDAQHGDGPQPVEGGHVTEADRPTGIIGHRSGWPGVGDLGDGAHRVRRPGYARALRGAPVHGSPANPRRPATTTGFGRPAGADPAQPAGVNPTGRLMVFFSRNSSRPSSPNSRPTPEVLYPPKGEEKSMGMLELTM